MKLWLHKKPAEVHRICQNVEHVDIRTLRCFVEQITSVRSPGRFSRHAIAYDAQNWRELKTKGQH